LADFILGKEGQQIMADAEYFPAHPGVAAAPQLARIVPNKAGYKENYVTPQQLKEQIESTDQIIQKLFR
jgi:ABC-type Fe3+ transport system substrate-binding protein